MKNVGIILAIIALILFLFCAASAWFMRAEVARSKEKLRSESLAILNELEDLYIRLKRSSSDGREDQIKLECQEAAAKTEKLLQSGLLREIKAQIAALEEQRDVYQAILTTRLNATKRGAP